MNWMWLINPLLCSPTDPAGHPLQFACRTFDILEPVILTDFTANFQQDVIARSQSHAGGDLVHNTFTQVMIEYLVDAQELEGGVDCYHKARGMEVSGYNVNEEEESLDLFISHFTALSLSITMVEGSVRGS